MGNFTKTPSAPAPQCEPEPNLIEFGPPRNPLRPDPRYCGGRLWRQKYLDEYHPLNGRTLDFTPGIYGDYAVLQSISGNIYAIAPEMVHSCTVDFYDRKNDIMAVCFRAIDGTCTVDFPPNPEFMILLIHANMISNNETHLHYNYSTRVMGAIDLPQCLYTFFEITRAPSTHERMPKTLNISFPMYLDQDWSEEVSRAIHDAMRIIDRCRRA